MDSQDEAILLKLKREFTTNEAVQSLLKIVSALEVEIGVLKSERDEAIDRAKEGRTKKEWLKEELVSDLNNQMKRQQKRLTEANKAMEEWRNKYFSLMASKSTA